MSGECSSDSDREKSRLLNRIAAIFLLASKEGTGYLLIMKRDSNPFRQKARDKKVAAMFAAIPSVYRGNRKAACILASRPTAERIALAQVAGVSKPSVATWNQLCQSIALGKVVQLG